MQPIPFIDLAAQRDRIRDKVDARLKRIVDTGAFIMGPEVAELEDALSRFSHARHTLTCASGTDALLLPLMAWGIGPGDAVFVPSFTFAASAEVVVLAGGTPVFVDVAPDTFNMDPASLEAGIRQVMADGALTPRAVMAVDLFGQAADYPALRRIADAFGLKLLSDAAQGFGATLDGYPANRWADAVATSFYPAKPLGCWGDGGAVQTDDREFADIMRSIRVHGQGADKYDNVRIGLTARLDTMQAAVLLEKLELFPGEVEARMRVAARYRQALSALVAPQALVAGAVSTWAQYTVRVPGGARDALMAGLKERGVPSVVYYGRPLHRQTAYRGFPVANGALPVSDALSQEVVSLPMHAYLDEGTQDRIVGAVRDTLQGRTAKAA